MSVFPSRPLLSIFPWVPSLLGGAQAGQATGGSPAPEPRAARQRRASGAGGGARGGGGVSDAGASRCLPALAGPIGGTDLDAEARTAGRLTARHDARRPGAPGVLPTRHVGSPISQRVMAELSSIATSAALSRRSTQHRRPEHADRPAARAGVWLAEEAQTHEAMLQGLGASRRASRRDRFFDRSSRRHLRPPRAHARAREARRSSPSRQDGLGRGGTVRRRGPARLAGGPAARPRSRPEGGAEVRAPRSCSPARSKIASYLSHQAAPDFSPIRSIM